ncbi:hypothetical protein ACJMQP_26515 [Rhodopseudomonas palustris]
MQKAPNSAIGDGRSVPPEVNAYSDDVTVKAVKAIRAERGVDVSQPHWKTIEALGQVVRA